MNPPSEMVIIQLEVEVNGSEAAEGILDAAPTRKRRWTEALDQVRILSKLIAPPRHNVLLRLTSC